MISFLFSICYASSHHDLFQSIDIVKSTISSRLGDGSWSSSYDYTCDHGVITMSAPRPDDVKIQYITVTASNIQGRSMSTRFLVAERENQIESQLSELVSFLLNSVYPY
jgi:hypothetical protein